MYKVSCGCVAHHMFQSGDADIGSGKMDSRPTTFANSFLKGALMRYPLPVDYFA